jgi:hypothetical protein
VWETPGTQGLFCEHLDVYSETFPTSGMTVNGVAYELPTWEPAMDDSGSLSLLMTPVAKEGEKATFQQGSAQKALTGQVWLTNQIRDVYDLNSQLFRTPCAAEAEGGLRNPERAGATMRLSDQVREEVGRGLLLPTPVAQPSGNKPEEHLRKKPGREIVTDLAIITENNLLPTGGRMSQPSDAGRLDSDGQLLGQQNLLDAITENA